MRTTLDKVRFEVERIPLQTTTGIAVERDAIVRKDDKQVVGIVSKDYELIRHADVIDSVWNNIDHSKFHLNGVEYDGAGGRVYMGIDSNYTHEIAEKDDIKARVIVTNSYDGSTKVGFFIYAVRLVCTNGMTTMSQFTSLLRKHTSGFDIGDVSQTIEQSLVNFESNVLPAWRKMAVTRLAPSEVKSVLEEANKIVGERITKRVYESIGSIKEMSAWDVWNAFTAYMTHAYKGQVITRLDHENRIARMMANRIVTDNR